MYILLLTNKYNIYCLHDLGPLTLSVLPLTLGTSRDALDRCLLLSVISMLITDYNFAPSHQWR